MSKIQITNREVIEAASALRALSEMAMPAVASLKVVRLSRAVETAAQDVLRVRQQVVERHALRGEDGALLPATDEEGREIPGHVRLADPDACGRELAELMDAATTLEAEPLRAEELGAGFSVAPRVLLMLGPVLES